MSLLVVGSPTDRAGGAARAGRRRAGDDLRQGAATSCSAPSTSARRSCSATCNRIEVYAEVERFHGGVAESAACSRARPAPPSTELSPHVYVH